MQVAEILTFTDVLRAPRRSAEIPEAADAYGWLVGSWALDCHRYAGEPVSIPGEEHFGWALEGRAIQDVWIMPSRSGRGSVVDRTKNMFGTTLRVWDSSIQAWRINWRNPVHSHWEDQIGRWSGKDVVQIGVRANGTPTRWSFTEITKDSFHWLGEIYLMSMAKRGNSKVNSLRGDSIVETKMAETEVPFREGSEHHAKNYATSVV